MFGINKTKDLTRKADFNRKCLLNALAGHPQQLQLLETIDDLSYDYDKEAFYKGFIEALNLLHEIFPVAAYMRVPTTAEPSALSLHECADPEEYEISVPHAKEHTIALTFKNIADVRHIDRLRAVENAAIEKRKEHALFSEDTKSTDGESLL